MNDKPIEIAVRVPAETKRAVERAAAAVSEFIEKAVKKMLGKTGYDLRKPGIN